MSVPAAKITGGSFEKRISFGGRKKGTFPWDRLSQTAINVSLRVNDAFLCLLHRFRRRSSLQSQRPLLYCRAVSRPTRSIPSDTTTTNHQTILLDPSARTASGQSILCMPVSATVFPPTVLAHGVLNSLGSWSSRSRFGQRSSHAS